MKTNQAICLAPVKWAKHQWLPGDIWIPGLYSGKAPSGPCWAEVQLPLDGYLMLKKREPKGEGFQCTYKLENSVRYFKMDFGTGENEYMQGAAHSFLHGGVGNDGAFGGYPAR